MKKLLFLLFLAFFATAAAFAQVPKCFNYHGVVAEKNSQVKVSVSIINIATDPNLTQSDHPTVYSESHVVNTNANGAFTLKIGTGSRTGSVNFEDVDFCKGSLGVKIVAGSHTSVFPLVSVPYAMVAQSIPGFVEAQQEIQNLKTLLSDYKSLLSKVENLENDNSTLKSKLSTLEKDNISLLSKVSILEKDNADLKKSASKIENLEGNVEALNGRVTTVEDAISSLGNRVSALEAGGDDGPIGTNGYINGHEYVNLGLSVKWATCNVGASKPEDSGYYFAWGETSPKTIYDWSTYRWCNGNYNNITKYFTPTTAPLEFSDDAARVILGGSWRMPTKAEQDELREKCTWTWTSLNGVNGYKVTGSNGNSIFLPAAGYRNNDSLNGVGTYGNYWSSLTFEIFTYYSDIAYGLYFQPDGVSDGSSDRCYGLVVRAVCP